MFPGRVASAKQFVAILALAIALPTLSAPTHLVNEPPVSIHEVEPGVFLVDFGAVAFGNLLLNAAPDTRARVTVHFGESLKDGRVNRNPPGTVRYRDTSETITGGELQRIAPGKDDRNTRAGDTNTPPAIRTPEAWDVLIPFRWVEIERFPGKLMAANVSRSAAFLRDWNDNAASFHSSNGLLNRIWELSRYSIKATTFAGVYVDGDRERIPYEGDAYLNQLSHYYTDYDKQMARDTFDHLLEHPTWPTEWASHMVFIAHADWMHTGDTQWLRQRYEPLQEKLLLNRAGADGLVTSNPAQIAKGDLVDWPPGERDGYVFSPINTVVNAFHLRSLLLMSDIANAVGDEAGSLHYRETYQRTNKQFQSTLFSPEEGLYLDGVDTGHHSLHANLFPLAFGLVPVDRQQHVASWVARQNMRCSVYAAQYLLEGLFENGHATRALSLITAEGDRSWRHMLDNNATITWEAWSARYKPNLDWNHAWGAAPANLLPRYILGVTPLEPGWHTARIRPTPGNLAFAKGRVPTPHGAVDIDWRRDDGFRLTLSLPAGMEGKLELPAQPESRGVKVNGEAVSAQKIDGLWLLDEPVTGNAIVEVLGR